MAQLVEWSLDEPRDPQLESYSIFEIFLSIVTQAVLQNCFLLIMFQSQIYEEAGNVALQKQCKFSHIRIGWILQSIILNMIATLMVGPIITFMSLYFREMNMMTSKFFTLPRFLRKDQTPLRRIAL